LRAIVGKSFAAQFEDKYVVFVHSNTAPADIEWSRVVAEYQRMPNSRACRVLVYTTGGAPTAAQRAQLFAALGSAMPRIAILTESVMARIAAKAVSLFVPELRVFDAHQVDAALDYLELIGQERAGARDALESLRKNIAAGREPRSLH
jgi:hypothetical protein